MDIQEYTSLFSKISKFIKVKDRSSNEVRSFLVSKHISKKKIDQFLKLLIENDIINENRLVKYFIYSGFENFYGEKYLIEKLKERHIDDNIIQSELENYNKEMWLEKCSNFIEKKFGKDLSNLKPTRIFSCVKTVYNRGYDLNTIQIVLKDKRVNSEILETLENI